jgi:uncharacterized membrane protein YfcA
LTGAAGPYAAMYLYGLGLTSGEFVFLSSVSYLLFDFSQLGAILYTGLYDATRFFYALTTIVPVMGGTYLGIWFRARLDERQFKKLVLLLLLVSAGALIFRATSMAPPGNPAVSQSQSPVMLVRAAGNSRMEESVAT